MMKRNGFTLIELMALGYKPAEAQRAIANVKNQHENTADLIRAALKAMVK